MPHADARSLPDIPDAAAAARAGDASDAVAACLGGLRAADLSVRPGDGDWSPERDLPPSLWELFASPDDAAGEALALAFSGAFAARRAAAGDEAAAMPWLWVQDAASLRKAGRPCLHGLPAELRAGLVHVVARNPADALWAMDEGVRCGALAFVLGEIAGDPRALDFTATRRLVLAAERHGVPLCLVRRDGTANLSAARLRWRVSAAPAAPHRWDAQAPGAPRAMAELFRGQALRPASFLLDHALGAPLRSDGHDGALPHPRANASHRLAVVPQPRDRPVEPQRSLAG